MSEDKDANYIRLPAAVFFALIGATTFGGAGIYGTVGQPNNNQLESVVKTLSSVQETARAALSLATQNGQRINDNNQLIYNATRSRYLATEADEDWRKQEARNTQIERRLMMIERELDNMRDEQ